MFAPSLAPLLPGWLRRQAWFVTPGVPLLAVEVEDVTPLTAEPLVCWASLACRFSGERTMRLRLLLALAPDADGVSPEALLGTARGFGASAQVYEAMAHPATALAACRALFPSQPLRSATPAGGGTSCSRVHLDGRWEAKVSRWAEQGPNPDVEVPAALAKAGYTRVAPTVAVVREDGVDLAWLRPWLPARDDAAELAREGLGEVLTRRCPPRAAHRDVADAFEQLGFALAEFHVAMAAAFGAAEADGAAWAEDLLGPHVRVAGDRVNLPKVAAIYRRLGTADDLGWATRIHQNLDVDRMSLGPHGWTPVDFEGDGRPLGDLRSRCSPLRDLADLFLGVDRLRQDVCSRFWEGDEERDREVAVLAEAWDHVVGEHLIAGYTSFDDVQALLPRGREARDILLSVFELDRTIGRALPTRDDAPWVGVGGGRP